MGSSSVQSSFIWSRRTFDGYVESEVINWFFPLLLSSMCCVKPLKILSSNMKWNSVPTVSSTIIECCSDSLQTGDFGTDALDSGVPIPSYILLYRSHDGVAPIFITPGYWCSHSSLSLQQGAEDGEAMSTPLGRALSRLSKENMIVVTNFSTTVLINHVDEKLTVACEVAPFVPLRHLLASYIHDPCHSTISIW
jgi:hypothetical protein